MGEPRNKYLKADAIDFIPNLRKKLGLGESRDAAPNEEEERKKREAEEERKRRMTGAERGFK